MKKSLIIIFSIFILMLAVSSVSASNETIVGETYVVDGSAQNQMNNPTIQTAIDNAKDGDTINITGTSYEHCHFIVDKKLNIISNVKTSMSTCPSNDKVSGGYGVFYFSQNASGSVLSGFTFTNGAGVKSAVDPYAVYVNGAEDIQITDCTVRSVDEGPGIYLTNTKNILINNTSIKSSTKGVYVTNSDNITITNSNITNNKNAGIYVGEGVKNIQISYNNISANNWMGIYFESCSNATVLTNYITANRDKSPQTRSTLGTGVYVNSTSINNLNISGNYIVENGNYGIFTTYLGYSDVLKQAEYIDSNFFMNHKTRVIFSQQNARGDTGLIYVGSNFYASEQFCPSIFYYSEPSVKRDGNSRDLGLGEITQVSKGVYTVSVIKKYTGEIATTLSTIDLTFILNKQSNKGTVEDGDQYIIAHVENGIATADFNDAYYKKTNNTLTVLSQGYGVIRYDGNADRLCGAYTISDSDIGKVSNTTVLKGNNITSQEGEFEYSVVLTDGYYPIAGQNITFTLEGKTYTNTTDSKGVAVLSTNLGVGNYTVSSEFKKTSAYSGSSTANTLVIVKTPVTVSLNTTDLEKYYGGSERFRAVLTDGDGNPMVNQTVTFVVNGKSTDKQTNPNGVATLGINLNSGIYNITTIYNETIEVKNTITVLSTVSGNDIEKIYRNGTQFVATFLDVNGNPLNKTTIQFNINGIFYNRTTNANGVARLNINLIPSNYTITSINTNTTEQASNNVKVLSNLVDNNDVVKYYKNATQYSVKALDDVGNPIAGQNVTFNINGMIYKRTTNANGVARLNLNLPQGNYTVTAEYNGNRVSNNIEILSVLSANDTSITYGEGGQFTARLVDGQGNSYAGQKVDFNINGVVYTKTTNSNGLAKLSINLMAGEYIITTSYNGLNIANKITIS